MEFDWLTWRPPWGPECCNSPPISASCQAPIQLRSWKQKPKNLRSRKKDWKARKSEMNYRRWRRGSWEATLKEETVRWSWWRRPSVLSMEFITWFRFCFPSSLGSLLWPIPPFPVPPPPVVAPEADEEFWEESISLSLSRVFLFLSDYGFADCFKMNWFSIAFTSLTILSLFLMFFIHCS